MDSTKKTASAQQNLRNQMQAADLLIADFLTFTWSEKGQDYSALKARYERHCSVLDAAGHLLPHVVMYLFAKLEERANYEINTWSALAQTIDPDGVARQRDNVPPEVLGNIHALHQHLPKAAHSKQAKDAASAPRPGGRHPDRQRIETEFKKLIANDPLYFKVRGNKTRFINEMLTAYPNVSKASASNWMRGLLSE
ncbi:hypothetical protein EKG40_15505 [Pseudomonas moorei]|nr:hypothetical protein EKG40_15505 [Pseudomonas moorei]